LEIRQHAETVRMVEALHQLVEQAQILAIDYAKFVVESPLQKTIAKDGSMFNSAYISGAVKT
jgi:hypothetical protein